MEMWRELTEDEKSSFRKWADDNYEKGAYINPTWHPVVRTRCHEMNAEGGHCKWCGGNLEMEDIHGVCHACQFWIEKINLKYTDTPHHFPIINGNHYMIGPEDVSKECRGYGGKKFKILFNDGEEIETQNLWHQGKIPQRWIPHFPNNAEFNK